MIVPLLGIALGVWMFRRHGGSSRFAESKLGQRLCRFLRAGWGFDWVYDLAFVKPFVALTRVNKKDAVDYFYRVAAGFTRAFHYIFALTQTGRLRWYAANMAFGLVIVLLIATAWL